MDPVGLARVSAFAAVAAVGLAVAPVRAMTPQGALRIDLWADRDDDDADGVPDGEQGALAPAALEDLVPIDSRIVGAKIESVRGGEHVRVISKDGAPWDWGKMLPPSGWFEGITPGRVEIDLTVRGEPRQLVIDVAGLEMRDGKRNLVDMARSHASLERTPPERDRGPNDTAYDDVDALRVVLVSVGESTGADAFREIGAESVTSAGSRLDELPAIRLTPSPCSRPFEGVHCWASAPLRLVADDVDRNSPLVSGRSLKAEVGGAIVFRKAKHKAQMIRVLGPRASPVGPIGRLRATLRPFVFRVSGGAPAIGGTDAGAIEMMRAEAIAASAIWGQCGITLGDVRALDVKVVDPPPPALLAIGDGMGICASGGEIRFRADGRMISVSTLPGESPGRVAAALARAAEATGLFAVVSPNAPIGPALGPSFDVLLRRKDHSLARIDVPPGTRLSTDAALTIRIGSVDLSDGLAHFTDMDSMAGTLEERTLLKSIDDGDPATIEVVAVPLFAGGGRIGESFIGSDLSSIRNVILLDRAGIRSRKSSLALAHELGHVLMDLPGHPDDYGIDTPTLLMDSDAADASPFGPRRISVDECGRAIRQAGPLARSPLLVDWPVGPIGPFGIARSPSGQVRPQP